MPASVPNQNRCCQAPPIADSAHGISGGGANVDGDLDRAPAVGHRCGRGLEDVDDVGGLLGAGAVRSALGDRVRHLGDAAGPRRARETAGRTWATGS